MATDTDTRTDTEPMDEPGMADLLLEVLENLAWTDAEDLAQAGMECAAPLAEAEAESFDAAGLLTWDKGVVVRLADGTEFQITVRQSR